MSESLENKGTKFTVMNERKRAEARKMREKNLSLLKENKVQYKVLDEVSGHLRIGQYDFWLGSGKFVFRPRQQWGVGVMEVINAIGEVTDSRFCANHSDHDCFGEVIQCNECQFYLKD